MKTAGELLQEKRLTRELEIIDIAHKIKVKPEYLTALENSDFESLPSPTTTKGYLRNYARALRLNPDTAGSKSAQDRRWLREVAVGFPLEQAGNGERHLVRVADRRPALGGRLPELRGRPDLTLQVQEYQDAST